MTNPTRGRPRLILVRHGETDYNKGAGPHSSVERVRGMIDVPLDAQGKRQAYAIGEHLEGEGIGRVYASPMQRSRLTAEELAQRIDVGEVTLDGKLCPWDPGQFAGQPVKHVMDDIRRLYRDENETPPGGGEPFARFRERWLTRLRELLAECLEHDVTICAVTHSRNIQCALAWVAAGHPADLHIDLGVMGDYDHGVVTGGELVLMPVE